MTMVHERIDIVPIAKLIDEFRHYLSLSGSSEAV